MNRSGPVGWSALLLLVLVFVPGGIEAGERSIQVREAVVQEEPSFLSAVVGKLKYGDRVEENKGKGAWSRIETEDGLEGWVHSSALTTKKIVLEASDEELEVAASDDELALAGKGFNAEVEARFRSENREIDFRLVDRMEEYGIEVEELITFLEEGEVFGDEDGPGLGKRTKNRFKKFGKRLASRTGRLVGKSKVGDTQVGKVFESITPEQEYYIGRTVAATVLHRYRPRKNDALNSYLNQVGQALARASDRPETFGGYRFQALDSKEINAFATPGGLIFVTRGMLDLCQREDDVAAVLAHEVAHVQYQHGLRSIRSNRLSGAVGTLAQKAGSQLAEAELDQLASVFNDSVGDITNTMLTSGYSRQAEKSSDRTAVELLSRLGYDPYALVDVLERMEEKLGESEEGFGATHPAASDRQDDLTEEKDFPEEAAEPVEARAERFAAIFGRPATR